MTPDYSSLGGRAQEILRVAEEQARETTHRASTAADDLVDGAQRDADRMRDDTAHELAGLREHRLAELDELRRRTEEDDTASPSSARRRRPSSCWPPPGSRPRPSGPRPQARAHDLVQSRRLRGRAAAGGGPARGRRGRRRRGRAPRDHLRRAASARRRRRPRTSRPCWPRRPASRRPPPRTWPPRPSRPSPLRAEALADAEQVRTAANAGRRGDDRPGAAAGRHDRRAGPAGVRLAPPPDAPGAGAARPATFRDPGPADLAERAGRRDRGQPARGPGDPLQRVRVAVVGLRGRSAGPLRTTERGRRARGRGAGRARTGPRPSTRTSSTTRTPRPCATSTPVRPDAPGLVGALRTAANPGRPGRAARRSRRGRRSARGPRRACAPAS